MSDQNIFDTTFTEKTKKRFARQRDTFNEKRGELQKKYPVRFWLFAGGIALILLMLLFTGIRAAIFDHTENYLRLEAQQDTIATVDINEREEKAREYHADIDRINCNRVDEEFQKDCVNFTKDAKRLAISVEESAQRELQQEKEQAEKREEQERVAEEQRAEKEAMQTDIDTFETFKEATLTAYDRVSSQKDVNELVTDTGQFYSAKQPQDKVDLINRAAKEVIPVMKTRRSAVNFECQKTSDEQKELCEFLIEDMDAFEKVVEKFFDNSNEFRFSPTNLSEENYKSIGEAFGSPKRGVAEILK